MTHSIELLPDAATDAVIRAEWAALADAGVPNQGDVAADTNRPHVTLLAAPTIGVGAIGNLAPVAMRLPITCRLGAPIVFGHPTARTLARLVVPTAELLSIHATVARLVAPALPDPAFGHCLPGAWTPHLTLARRVTAAQVGAALSLLDAGDAPITFTALRQWDGDARIHSVLPGRNC